MDRQTISPSRALMQLNQELQSNLRKVQLRILSPGSTGDTFTSGAQDLAVQTIAPAGPFTTLAQLEVVPGSWLICGCTSINNGLTPWTPVASVTPAYVDCRICADGVPLITLDWTHPFWYDSFIGANLIETTLGVQFSPITRSTFIAATTLTLEARVSSASGVTPSNSQATRSRLLVSPY